MKITKQNFKENRKALDLSARQLAKLIGLGKCGDRWIRRIESTNEKDARYQPSPELCERFELLIDKCNKIFEVK